MGLGQYPGNRFSFHIHIKEGAGAFVCGEETALMASIMASAVCLATAAIPSQLRPLGQTYQYQQRGDRATVPDIILRGADWFASWVQKR